MGDEGDKFGRGIEMEVKAKKEIWKSREFIGEWGNTRERPEKGRSNSWALVNAETLGLSGCPNELVTRAKAELLVVPKSDSGLWLAKKGIPLATTDKSNLLPLVMITSRARYFFLSDYVGFVYCFRSRRNQVILFSPPTPTPLDRKRTMIKRVRMSSPY